MYLSGERFPSTNIIKQSKRMCQKTKPNHKNNEREDSRPVVWYLYQFSYGTVDE